MSRALDRLGLAATPTFAAMAVFSALDAGPAQMLCAPTTPLSGMVAMYLLMAVFHAGPWVKLLRDRTAGAELETPPHP